VAVGNRVRRAAISAVVLALALAAAPLLADYREVYKRGVDAFEQKRWEEAARLMRQAIAEHPEAGAGLLGIRRYTPQYFLGIALAEQGDCRGAVEALDSAEKQGKITKEEARILGQRRQTCRARLQKSGEAVEAAKQELDAAAAVAARIAEVQGSPLMREAWRDGSPSFASRQETAGDHLAAARALLAHAERELDADKAAEAARGAQAAGRELETLLAAATARREQVQAEVQRALSALQKTVEEARRRLTFVNRTFAPLPAAIGKQAARLDKAIAGAAAADAGTPEAELGRLQNDLKVSLRELQAAIKPPPEELQRAAAAYLGGDYAGALAALESAKLAEPRAAAHACLLRAASLHGLRRVQAKGAGGDEAREELRRCVAAPQVVEPLATVFPPSFLALYAEVAAAAAPHG